MYSVTPFRRPNQVELADGATRVRKELPLPLKYAYFSQRRYPRPLHVLGSVVVRHAVRPHW
jgi:hypothetical protein